MSTAVQPSPPAPAASGAEAQEATPNPINVPIVVRNFKASDLPLTSATRSAIEGLAHSFKKKGGYDAIRKQVWEKFANDHESEIVKQILQVAEQEVERNPLQLLTLDRGKAAALIDGALDRNEVYQKAQAVIESLIDTDALEAHLRELRRAEIGDEAAEEERIRGSKTDQEYAAETAARRAERERVREELRLVEEKKRRLEREIKEKEEQKRREERRKKQLEEDAIREKEREERRARREQRERERELSRERRHRERDRNRSRDRDRHRDRDRDRDRDRGRGRSRDRSRGRDRRPSRDAKARNDHGRPEDVKTQLSKEDNERLEQEALADLLRESKRVAAKQPELEVDTTLAPPPRRTKPASAIDPIRRASPKVAEVKKTADIAGKSGGVTEETKEAAIEPKETVDTKDVKEPKETATRKQESFARGSWTSQPLRARGVPSEAVHTGENIVASVFVIGESAAVRVPDWTAETIDEMIMSEIGAVLDGGRQSVVTGAARVSESLTGETTLDGLEAVHALHEMAVRGAALHGLELIVGIAHGLA
ncbi:hypothetical protein N0V85_005415 [Neurospora sp. IMI 360204]|nr:hypothetical protein N0V85_005415 [Neurospora sp. IMI 360204]